MSKQETHLENSGKDEKPVLAPAEGKPQGHVA